MIEFLRRYRLPLASIALLLVSVALVVTTSGKRTRSDRVGELMLDIVAPVLRVTSFASQAVAGTWQRARDVFRGRDDIALLRARVDELARVTSRLAEVEQENGRLHELLGLRGHLQGDVIAARIIGRDATGIARTLTIDRGTGAGVMEGASVMAPGGVVGHVFAAAHTSARVLLITDHNSGVDALVQRTRAIGIVQGSVGATCGLKYLKRTEDLRLGDQVLTSGLDGVFPKGVPIGSVTTIDKRGQGLFLYATVTPYVDFSRLEEVLVARGPLTIAPEPEPLLGPALPPDAGVATEIP